MYDNTATNSEIEERWWRQRRLERHTSHSTITWELHSWLIYDADKYCNFAHTKIQRWRWVGVLGTRAHAKTHIHYTHHNRNDSHCNGNRRLNPTVNSPYFNCCLVALPGMLGIALTMRALDRRTRHNRGQGMYTYAQPVLAQKFLSGSYNVRLYVMSCTSCNQWQCFNTTGAVGVW